MLKALADRLAEAFTELLHQRVRREFWGYAKDEKLPSRRPDRRACAASGRRPVIPPARITRRRGRSSELLKAERIRHAVDRGYAMHPASSVSGFYFHIPSPR
jgi:5-methyltetrahydrofolate--homocysteine methyltransferase